jgi:hypothetical protein
MNVLEYEQGGLLFGMGFEQRQYGRERSIFLLLWGQFEGRISSSCRNR